MNVDNLLQEKNIKYYNQGQDFVIRCLNTDHDDAHPSLRIDRVSGMFNCFSCGFKGNIFSYFGKKIDPIDAKTANIKNKIQNLRAHKKVELPHTYSIFMNDYRGIKAKTLIKYNPFVTDEIEGMQDRIIFPITNVYGDIKVLCGRRLFSDADPKYKFYPKHTEVPLFPAIPEQIINGSIILVEGIFDVLNLTDKGLANSMCAFGTTKIASKKKSNADKLEYLQILGVNKVFVMFDGEEQAIIEAERTAKVLTKYFITDTIELPEGRDPGNLSYEEVKQLRTGLYENSTS